MLILIFLLCGCSNEYRGWQSIDIDGVGTFKVPADWIYTEEDDIVYFTKSDESEKLVIGAVNLNDAIRTSL